MMRKSGRPAARPAIMPVLEVLCLTVGSDVVEGATWEGPTVRIWVTVDSAPLLSVVVLSCVTVDVEESVEELSRDWKEDEDAGELPA